jgi:hypothetical protein
MFLEGLDSEIAVPKADRAVRECGAADLTGEEALDPGKFVLQVLGLVAECAAAAIGAGGLDGVADTFGAGVDAVGDDGKVGREQAVIVDEDDVGEALADAGANELSNQFAADRAPGVVDAVGGADGFGIVERNGGIAVVDDLQYCKVSISRFATRGAGSDCTNMFYGGKISSAASSVPAMIFPDL